MVGGKAAVETGAVTHGAVRCSAWLDPTANARTILFIRITEFLPEITLLLFHDAKMQNEQQHAGRDHKPETVGEEGEGQHKEQKRYINRIAAHAKNASHDKGLSRTIRI